MLIHISLISIGQGFAMYIQVQSRQHASPRDAMSRLAEWWPAALIGIVALLNGLPEGAQTFLS